jgi:hypothetical protein
MFTRALFHSTLVVSTLGACAAQDLATSEKASALDVPVELTGTVHTTARSGHAGVQFTLGTSTSDTYALWGLSGKEHSDDPCWVHIKTENVNDINDQIGHTEDLCGAAGGNDGSLLVADFANTDFTGPRAFVSGVEVCMNSDDSKVKGWILHGRQINANGTLTDLANTALGGPRANCSEPWKQRVDCPAGELATAAVLEFDSTSEPRAWLGISLKCRALAPS